jgi:hypothetical protein
MIAPPGYNLAEVESIAQILIPELQQRLEDDPALFHRGETDIPALRFFSMFVDAQGISVITDPKNAGDLEALMKALEMSVSVLLIQQEDCTLLIHLVLPQVRRWYLKAIEQHQQQMMKCMLLSNSLIQQETKTSLGEYEQ